jgi:23S rRNA maturation-related 3'-5' exoribonuclease YhaM
MVDERIKSEAFADELDLIFNEITREFTRLCIVSAPDYIFIDCPASSTGKYHPIGELGPDGNIIHTKKIFTLAYTLCRGLHCENHRDEILAACLIHDLRKQGITKLGHTVKNHPALAADLVEEVQQATQMLSDESYKIIRNCCGYHYGPWSIGEWKKPLEKYTPEELCVYIADYVVSKREVQVDFRRDRS